MSFGWAYVSCDDIAITEMTGPSGSLLVRTGTFTVSGSDNLKLFQESTDPAAHALMLTGSFKQLGDLYVTGSMRCSGDVEIAGNLTANSYNVVNTTVTEIHSDGGTVFGDHYVDQHQITGSFMVKGSEDIDGMGHALVVTGAASHASVKVGIVTDNPTSMFTINGSVGYRYDAIQAGTTAVLMTVTSSIVGIRNNTATTVTLPAASGIPGRIYIIKDEGGTQPRTSGNKITVSPNGSDTIDDQAAYYIMGSRAALSLYSNGSDAWFVF